LAAFPIAVEQLSRMRSEEEAKAVLAGLAAGTVDIVIGTHRLLQRDVRFKNLGLVVLDEEQRFGVLQKERLKQLRAAVDVLSLSATPIPRTLHMALAGIRDLSVVRTPPEGRLPIRTYVTAKEKGLVQDVIRRELARQGQVFYVHNRIQTIQRELDWLRELVPEARLALAHGQMDDGALARVMVAFMAGEVDVLCCTTIIENGLDIPNANTLVVDDASRMGLSQLYQLRGRVGRSGQRAYAYFLRSLPRRRTSVWTRWRISRTWARGLPWPSRTWRSEGPATSWVRLSTETSRRWAWRRTTTCSARRCSPRRARSWWSPRPRCP
jgi:transcription-repair coupling factor (superfamily II helicase)